MDRRRVVIRDTWERQFIETSRIWKDAFVVEAAWSGAIEPRLISMRGDDSPADFTCDEETVTKKC